MRSSKSADLGSAVLGVTWIPCFLIFSEIKHGATSPPFVSKGKRTLRLSLMGLVRALKYKSA